MIFLTQRGQRCLQITLVAVVGLILSFSARGYATTISLASDSNAMSGWHDYANFQATGATKALNGKIEYAVYDLTQFRKSFPSADVRADDYFVYAYQIFNTTSTDTVGTLSVGLAADSSPVFSAWLDQNQNPSNPDGMAPLSSQFTVNPPDPPTSTVWYFNSPNRIPAGGRSQILYFTSPFGPGEQSSTIRGGQLETWSGSLPSPVPEPSVFVLLSLAAGGVLCVRWNRFRHSH